jgi:hypothetical protein
MHPFNPATRLPLWVIVPSPSPWPQYAGKGTFAASAFFGPNRSRADLGAGAPRTPGLSLKILPLICAVNHLEDVAGGHEWPGLGSKTFRSVGRDRQMQGLAYSLRIAGRNKSPPVWYCYTAALKPARIFLFEYDPASL